MQTEITVNPLSLASRLALRRQEMLAEGRYNAFVFVRECQGDIVAIQDKIEMYKHLLSDPLTTARGQSYAPNTTVREHAEGYLAGLKDALQILTTDGEVSAEEPLLKARAPHKATPKRRKAVAEKGTRYATRRTASRK